MPDRLYFINPRVFLIGVAMSFVEIFKTCIALCFKPGLVNMMQIKACVNKSNRHITFTFIIKASVKIYLEKILLS